MSVLNPHSNLDLSFPSLQWVAVNNPKNNNLHWWWSQGGRKTKAIKGVLRFTRYFQQKSVFLFASTLLFLTYCRRRRFQLHVGLFVCNERMISFLLFGLRACKMDVFWWKKGVLFILMLGFNLKWERLKGFFWLEKV